MSFRNDTPTNIQHLVDMIPNMPGVVARAWLRCEAQATYNPSNPLNILYYGRLDRNQIAQRGRFAVYPSAYEGLRDAAGLILRSHYYEGVRYALQSKDPLTIARAIEESPWAGGHYGGAGVHDGCIVRALGAPAPAPAPTPAPTPAPAPAPSGNIYVVKPGDSLWKIAARFYGKGLLWRVIYAANKGVIGPNPSLIHPGQRLTIPPR